MTRRSGAEISALLIERLMAKPATLGALCVTIGVRPNACCNTVKPYVMAWRERGLVYVADWFHGTNPMYQWQPRPFECEDVPRPEKAEKQRPPKPQTYVAMPSAPASAFSWGMQS